MGIRARSLVTAIVLAMSSLALTASANDDAIPNACTPPIKCCRICTTGKACGKTCIEESKTCTSGRGCACNVADVCAEDP